MQFETIKLDPRIARIHYNDYRKRCRANREARKARMDAEADAWARKRAGELSRLEREDAELLKAYQALCGGVSLIDVAQTVRKAGIDDKLRLPLLAICRADFETIVFNTGANPSTEGRPWKYGKDARGVESVVPASSYPAEVTNNQWRVSNRLPTTATALVPTVPAHFRPDDLRKYYILWEAEWRAEAPKDPLLLSRVNRTLFAIVAQWDLTPLEQRVLEGRL